MIRIEKQTDEQIIIRYAQSYSQLFMMHVNYTINYMIKQMHAVLIVNSHSFFI